VVVGFNYDLLETKVAEQVRTSADRTRERVKKTVEDIIEVGNDLLAVKEAPGAGEFGQGGGEPGAGPCGKHRPGVLENQTMRERVKVFTFVSGHGETVVEPPHEDHINQWLASVGGRLAHVSQSESERAGVGHHVTLCVWYAPEEPTPAAPAP
jgi:hypothetical protein